MDFFHPNWYVLFFWLVVFHFLADYPLQGDFLAQAKDRHSKLGQMFWYHALPAHGAIHAGFVMLATGVLWMAIVEWLAHVLIDYLKCEKLIDLDVDQFLHLVTKVVLVYGWVLCSH